MAEVRDRVVNYCNSEEFFYSALVDVTELTLPKCPIYEYCDKEANELDCRNLLATHSQLEVPVSPSVSIDGIY